MVNVIEPQFNLHSEEANGRFLLAAVSGRVLARSFHSIMRVGVEVIEQAFGHVRLHEAVKATYAFRLVEEHCHLDRLFSALNLKVQNV